MRLPAPPFVLLDDARNGGAPSRLYANPVEIVEARDMQQIEPALARLRQASGEGLHAAGYLNYEGSSLWFGLFGDFATLNADEVDALLPDPAGAWAGAPEPRIGWPDYRAACNRVLDYIRAGDIYQANLTFRAALPYAGGEAALFALLRKRARAGYGALIATGDRWLLSFSPELFFALEAGQLTARPMKGTAARTGEGVMDAEAARALAADAKQQAENLMIVDLMRNDLATIAKPGTVAVPHLFQVERYPTVYQMISTVTAHLKPELDAVSALRALFPCGSVTGAPKIRAMQIIGEVEQEPRDTYTGAIGRLDPNGDAMFNVAIRTLACDGAGRAVLGLGSGVVADSQPRAEWEECLAKGAFVTAGETRFDLIETMRFDPLDGILHLERHLSRIKESAAGFGFPFDRHAVRNELQAATFRLRHAARVRLLLGPSGAIAIGASPLPAAPAGPVEVAIRPLPVAPDDFRLRHKTSRRGFYDRARDATGAWEVVFTDPEGYLTEGSFTSVFVARNGVLVTPPLARGLLPGILRAELLETGRAVEGDLTPADLADGFFVGNAVRGLVAAVTVAESANADV
ncbi:aminodeoxychorismate synthase component I [Sphingomonas xinjiangensis]|uniref:Probable branched-chain-amino-acid aminotransferase n=1 Tax=Sphingomonas xinjiangensis TaxID=643568 RepID=A0A840YFX2_9SPHN|nr:aminodeoxychorismate synthase component I [Sphingomonas xinjiangensis]MBB5711195.1 para-aminobenzoate synthetase/4-amino-4-deoxychorismate lyase [Sphingomonas xinjiangensis]